MQKKNIWRSIIYYAILFIIALIIIALIILNHLSNISAGVQHHVAYKYSFYNYNVFTSFNSIIFATLGFVIFSITLYLLSKKYKAYNIHKLDACLFVLISSFILFLGFTGIMFYSLMLFPYLIFGISVILVLSMGLVLLS